MNHLSDQFFKQFLKNIKEDKDISSDFKSKIVSLYSNKKFSKGNHLKELLIGFESQQKVESENSEN